FPFVRNVVNVHHLDHVQMTEEGCVQTQMIQKINDGCVRSRVHISEMDHSGGREIGEKQREFVDEEAERLTPGVGSLVGFGRQVDDRDVQDFGKQMELLLFGREVQLVRILEDVIES